MVLIRKTVLRQPDAEFTQYSLPVHAMPGCSRVHVDDEVFENTDEMSSIRA